MHACWMFVRQSRNRWSGAIYYGFQLWRCYVVIGGLVSHAIRQRAGQAGGWAGQQSRNSSLCGLDM